MKLKKYFPLCFVEQDVLLLYKYGSLYLYDIKESRIKQSRKVIFSKKDTLLAKINPIFRFLRLGARLGVSLSDKVALILVGQTIYEVNVDTLELSSGYNNGRSRPLKFSVFEGLDGFEDGVYWGDYLAPSDRGEKYIYKRTGRDKWEVVYTFPAGELGHIHNIVPDTYHKCAWIFTGDFDNCTAIWQAKDNFKCVVPIFRGNQLYRGCVSFATEDGLLYATDAPFADNFICRMFQDKGVWKVEKLMPISGSCIYGTQLDGENYVFQTTVEPDGRKNGNKFVILFGRERGAGIKDDYVHLYVGNIKDGFKDVYQSKKDNWPYIAFQFGTFQFPSGKNEGGLLPFYSMATKDYCLETRILDLKDGIIIE